MDDCSWHQREITKQLVSPVSEVNARAHGCSELRCPPSLLATADEVIE
jgi:hypothetical protein